MSYPNKRIFLSSPTMHGEEQQFIKEAFDTNWVAPLGANVDGFEKEERIPATSRNVKSGNIQVTIQTRDGLHIRKSNLDYQGLMHLVERLEGLC